MDSNKKITIRVRGIILNEGKMLVAKLMSNDFYCLLGGKLEWGEDLKECLSRELIEELGVNPQIGRLLFVNTFIEKNGGQSIDFMFEVINGKDYLDLENIERTHAFEILDLCWVSPIDDTYILPKTLNEYFKKGEILSNEVRYIKD
jgi:ADP-ribose pyrophosphatase YjhB (NUDIX family)